uniref:Putative ATPase domain containing protein n=1 Tax=viral metagenome TaxID=1070528 RepID=A0A6M3ISV7_9ZZZZ
MEIKLKRLTLENFKGVKQFTLEPKGKDATIRGDNGTGKSTLMDAFLWLLFNKDSQGKADFAIKTLDRDGQEIHNLCHAVEVELEIGD